MPGSKKSRLFEKLARAAVRVTAALFLISAGAVFLLRFVPPATSAVMIERYCRGVIHPEARNAIRYTWVNWEAISPHTALAVVAAEDQKFPDHFGFDFASIAQALEEREDGGRLRGASTISQQVAKNLFLWNGRSVIRKGLEAGFTVLIELIWPKRRILEVYLNIAEFGEGIYGVQAAAETFFRKSASRLTKRESALLAAVLPNPVRLRAAAPSAYVTYRARRIEKQMKNLGPAYLKHI